jgi:hypothetical protein
VSAASSFFCMSVAGIGAIFCPAAAVGLAPAGADERGGIEPVAHAVTVAAIRSFLFMASSEAE